MFSRPPRICLRISIAVISVALCAGHRAHAQSAEAEALFDEGNRLMGLGKTAEACESFEASNRVEARAGTLIRLGECREQNHQLASAWSAYMDALHRVKDPRKREFAQTRASALEPRLSYLTISVPDESRVEGLELTRDGKPLDPMLWNRALPVDGGQYVIAGRAPGHEQWQTTVAVPDQNGKVSVDVPKFKEIAKLIAPPSAAASPASGLAVTANDDGRGPIERFPIKRKLAIGLGGAGVAAGITGIVLGLTAKHRQDQAYGLCPDPQVACADADQATSLVHSGHQLAIGADIAFGVGAAAVIAGAVLWFTTPVEGHRVAIVPAVRGDQAGIAIVTGF